MLTLALHTGMRRGEIQSLRWLQVDFLNRMLTVGATKTKAGTGRVIPLNERALITLQGWATNFPQRDPEHFVFPWEHYGLAGNERTSHSKTMDPTIPVREFKTAWEAAKVEAGDGDPLSRPEVYGLHPFARTRRFVISSGLHHGLECQHDGEDGETVRAHR